MKTYSILILMVLKPLISGFTSPLMITIERREMKTGVLAMSRKASTTTRTTSSKTESFEAIDEINDDVEIKFDPLRPFKNFSREIKKPCK